MLGTLISWMPAPAAKKRAGRNARAAEADATDADDEVDAAAGANRPMAEAVALVRVRPWNCDAAATERTAKGSARRRCTTRSDI